MRPIPQLGRSLRIVNVSVDDERLTAEVQAIPRGIIAWLLRLLRFKSVRVLSVRQHGFRFEQAGFWGDFRNFHPAGKVAAAVYEYRRPVNLLIFAAGFLFSTIALFAQHAPPLVQLISLVIGLVSVVLYAMRRKDVTIGVISSSGSFDLMQLHTDRFEAQNLQRVLRVMEAVLDRGHHAEPSALAQIPPIARERFTELPESAARRYEELGSTLDARAASAAGATDSGADTVADTLPPAQSFASPGPSGQSPIAPPVVATAPAPPATAGPSAAVAPAQGGVYACPHCQARMRVPPALLGKVVRCPACGREARVG